MEVGQHGVPGHRVLLRVKKEEKCNTVIATIQHPIIMAYNVKGKMGTDHHSK